MKRKRRKRLKSEIEQLVSEYELQELMNHRAMVIKALELDKVRKQHYIT